MLPRALDVSAFDTRLDGYNSLSGLELECECAKELQFDAGIWASFKSGFAQWSGNLEARKVPIEPPEFSLVPNQAWRA